ncbi:MAG: carboxypeptidase regulatory-like domain-containing protein [Planctomycetota bacterium]|jgi:outer membrane lipoprotein-sorting protein
MIEPLLKARSGRFLLDRQTGGGPQEQYKVEFIKQGRSRWTMPDGGVAVSDRSKGTVLVLMPGTKHALFLDVGRGAKANRADRFNVLGGVWHLLEQAARNDDQKVQDLGQHGHDGRAAQVYRVAAGRSKTTIWVDPETRLPIRVELIGEHGGHKTKVTIHTITYNVKLDKSRFDFSVPEGYKEIRFSAGDLPAGQVVTGHVVDESTGEPIAGARVADLGYGPEPRRGTVTDAKGRYEFSTWPEEHYVQAQARGYLPERRLVRTNELGEPTSKRLRIDFSLTPAG